MQSTTSKPLLVPI